MPSACSCTFTEYFILVYAQLTRRCWRYLDRKCDPELFFSHLQHFDLLEATQGRDMSMRYKMLQNYNNSTYFNEINWSVTFFLAQHVFLQRKKNILAYRIYASIHHYLLFFNADEKKKSLARLNCSKCHEIFLISFIYGRYS